MDCVVPSRTAGLRQHPGLEQRLCGGDCARCGDRGRFAGAGYRPEGKGTRQRRREGTVDEHNLCRFCII
jgi:hypothetical protein